ncbi:unnamed protein product [Adineta ricciae]|uniref:endo-1,4-beta-xylanase n=1 Tax=Adineta ricciae TaxID=249248 RepID=A0A0E3Z5J6_ADIRI|nr:glycoside hydrolase 10 [Adineta ricciae]CAF1600739.1 unnamed protein product [Adineta ricciae]
MYCVILLTVCICLVSVPSILTEDPIGLRVSATLRDIRLGTAVLVDNLQKNVDGGKYIANIKKNYQWVVAEVGMKPKQIWIGENKYNWAAGDWLIGSPSNPIGWIQQNGLQLRGHNLLWPGDNFMPTWLLQQESSITPDKAKSLLQDYITTVVTRYRGKIAGWDVVNEAIDDYDSSRPFNLRDSFWFRKLGRDFIKYAFTFAHNADPNVELFYNEYGIERTSLKANRTLELVNWLKSEGVTVHGVGMQWHIDVSKTVTPGDSYYQNAQRFIDQGFDILVTELDISVPMRNGKPINPADIQKQGVLYRSLLQYALHFHPKCHGLLTWGFTDRYSWLPSFSNNTKGDALPLDASYVPKPAYFQMQEELARVLVDGVYCLSPKSQPNKCLGVSSDVSSGNIQLYDGKCTNDNQKWNISWLNDGTYRLSPISANTRALSAYNVTTTVGGVQTTSWSFNANQEWVLAPTENKVYRVGPRGAWIRVMTVISGTANIGIVDYTSTNEQSWILTSI